MYSDRLRHILICGGHIWLVCVVITVIAMQATNLLADEHPRIWFCTPQRTVRHVCPWTWPGEGQPMDPKPWVVKLGPWEGRDSAW